MIHATCSCCHWVFNGGQIFLKQLDNNLLLLFKSDIFHSSFFVCHINKMSAEGKERKASNDLQTELLLEIKAELLTTKSELLATKRELLSTKAEVLGLKKLLLGEREIKGPSTEPGLGTATSDSEAGIADTTEESESSDVEGAEAAVKDGRTEYEISRELRVAQNKLRLEQLGFV